MGTPYTHSEREREDELTCHVMYECTTSMCREDDTGRSARTRCKVDRDDPHRERELGITTITSCNHRVQPCSPSMRDGRTPYIEAAEHSHRPACCCKYKLRHCDFSFLSFAFVLRCSEFFIGHRRWLIRDRA